MVDAKKGRTSKAGIGTNFGAEIWHLRKRDGKPGRMEASCGGRGGTGFVFGFRRFGRLRHMAKACHMCVVAWADELKSGAYRTMDRPSIKKR